MIEIPVYNQDGKQVDTVKVEEKDLGGRVRPELLKQAYVMYHANRRQGTVENKGRGDKEGSTRKLFRQKGTGRARRGNVRTNVMRGGGVTFAKRTKSWRQAMPKKMRRLATRNALLAKLVDGEIKLVDKFEYDEPKTSRFAKLINALGINRTCLVALQEGDINTALSARNIKDCTTILSSQLNAYDLLSKRFVVMEKAAIEAFLDGTNNNQEEAA